MFLTDYQFVYIFVTDIKDLPSLRHFYHNIHHNDNHNLNVVCNQPP